MSVRDHSGWRRAARRLLVGTVIAAGAVGLASQPASAATTATFTNGVLIVLGDGSDETIDVSRDPAGTILVNGGAVSITGGTPTVANTAVIQVFGRGGNDVITLDEANGALPSANLFGGAGDDELTGGSNDDLLFGEGGADELFGAGADDLLFGGVGHDRLTGGDGDDQAFGESGDDVMLWNPGDDTDLNEGGPGGDIVGVFGGGGAESFTTTANGARVRFDRVAPAPFALDIGTSELLLLNAGGGDDSFSATGNLAPLIGIGVTGAAGNDTILGGNGADWLIGDVGDDFVDGQQGNDSVFLSAGDDTFQWDPGDGSDRVDGYGGLDTMVFNGSAASETFQASDNGGRLRFTRDVGNIVMDTNNIEVLDLNALGGADRLTVDDLSATEVDRVDTDLAGTLGGAAGDGAIDTVVVNGTDGDDVIDVSGSGTSASVVGLAAQVDITNAEGANDELVVNALGGDDDVTATSLAAGVIGLTVDGGADGDELFGSQGADVLLGGDGDDAVLGDNGDDVAFLGAGNDTFRWDPGDGSDVVEGQAGSDAMLFNGAGASENIDIAANGGRVRFFRDVAAITMDLDEVEAIDFNALGGADNVVVGDLTGTDLTSIATDLSGPGGGGDGAADTVTVNGTDGADVFGAAGDADGVDVFGLHAAVDIASPEAADRLTLNGRGGDDVIDTTSLEADVIGLTVNGGLGADLTLGGAGDEVTNGGDGDDLALMGGGDDTFVWNPGDDNDTLEGQAGADTMLFNGANVAENIDIAANGGRVRFFRNIANVTMDLDDVELIDFNALGGADTIVVGDVSGTDLNAVDADLGGADAQADNVILEGTDGDDVIVVSGTAGDALAFGLAAQLNLTGFESANDRLTVDALAGDDVVDASGLSADSIQLTVNAGDGDDVVIGGAGDDVLNGGAGNDVLIGGPGLDIIDGGGDDDIEIQSIIGETVISATAASDEWLAAHLRIVDGRTVIDVGGRARALPQADLSALVSAMSVEPAEPAAPVQPDEPAEPVEPAAPVAPAQADGSAPSDPPAPSDGPAEGAPQAGRFTAEP